MLHFRKRTTTATAAALLPRWTLRVDMSILCQIPDANRKLDVSYRLTGIGHLFRLEMRETKFLVPVTSFSTVPL